MSTTHDSGSTRGNGNSENAKQLPSSDTNTLLDIRCAVCDAQLSNTGGNNDDKAEKSAHPFITFQCTQNCQSNGNEKDEAKRENGTNIPHHHQSLQSYCVPDCLEHFLQYQWGLYCGLGQAHQQWPNGLLGNACVHCRSLLQVVGSSSDDGHDRISSGLSNLLPSQGRITSLEEALSLVNPKLLAKALSTFDEAAVDTNQSATSADDTTNATGTPNTASTKEHAIIRRLTQQLEDLRLHKCPSCCYPIHIPADRGCDAAWCEHCHRALCLFCFMDCGDHPKTDSNAASSQQLIGDAHEHVLHNDCGYTAGCMHSGKLLMRFHEQRFLEQVALRLKRVSEVVRAQVCANLHLDPQALQNEIDDNKNATNEDYDNSSKDGNTGIIKRSNKHGTSRNMAQLCRDIENHRWEHYNQTMRIRFLHAAYGGDLPLTRLYLDAGIHPCIPDRGTGETALHFAAMKGRHFVVQELLHRGADPWQVSPKGRTALDYLCDVNGGEDHLLTARCLVRACMVSVGAVENVTASDSVDEKAQRSQCYRPWDRPWPNNLTARDAARLYHPKTELFDYFTAMKVSGDALNLACFKGRVDEIKNLLTNRTGAFTNPFARTTSTTVVTTTEVDRNRSGNEASETTNTDVAQSDEAKPSQKGNILQEPPVRDPPQGNISNGNKTISNKNKGPAADLLFLYNEGSGCTPLLEVCNKSKKLPTQTVLDIVRLLLDAAEDSASRDLSPNPDDYFVKLLLMRDVKNAGTALHWLAMDPRDEIIKTASLMIRYFNRYSRSICSNMFTNAVDRRGETALDWAQKYAIPANPTDPDVSLLRQRHVQRWQVLIMMFEE